MANLKEIRTRITSVNSTKQITSAMKMVSAAKLKRATDRIIQMRPYALKLSEVLQNLSGTMTEMENKFVEKREVQRVLLVPITSNRGLCGGFNTNVTKLTTRLTKETYANAEVTVLPVGKKVYDLYKKSDRLFNLFNWSKRYKKNKENPLAYFNSAFHKNAKYFIGKEPLHKLYPDKVKKVELFGKKYNEVIADSKIVINTHRDELCDYGNIRDFEVTGLGSLLITDKAENMKELFVDGEEYVSFLDKKDLLEKIEKNITLKIMRRERRLH